MSEKLMRNVVFSAGKFKVPVSKPMRISTFWLIAVTLVLVVSAVGVGLVIWLIASIFSVVNGGPDLWNIVGIVIPGILILSSIFSKS